MELLSVWIEVLFGGGDFKKLSDDDLGVYWRNSSQVDAGIEMWLSALVESGAVGALTAKQSWLLKSELLGLNGETAAETKSSMTRRYWRRAKTHLYYLEVGEWTINENCRVSSMTRYTKVAN